MPEYIPFTYQITSKTTGQHYYGVRFGKNAHPDTLWTTYFTSSRYIKDLIEKHGKDDFTVRIDQTFETAEEAREYEDQFIRNNNCVRDPLWLNLNRAGKEFYIRPISEEARRNMSEAHIGNIHSEETKRKMSESHTGKKASEETKRKMRGPKTAAHCHAMRGPKSKEHIANISKAKMGHLKGMRGMKHTEETKRKMRDAQRKRRAEEKAKRSDG